MKKNVEKNFRNKSHNAKKTERGDPLVSVGVVCYAEKEEKPFLLSSLGQMSHLGTIKLCRTFKNYFGQFVWIEKKKKKKSHYNSRVSLHGAPSKNVSFLFTNKFLMSEYFMSSVVFGHGCQEYAGRIFAYSSIFLALDVPHMQLHISEKSKC